MIIDPIRIYEIQGQTSVLQCASIGLTVANNQTIVAAIPAVAGVSAAKRIRVMGISGGSDAAGGSGYNLKDASGGTVLWRGYLPPTLTLMYNLPVTAPGYFETTAGNGLFADCATNAASINVFYITYTP